MAFPVPDLIAEVLSPGTEDRDRGLKFIDYAASGVREYWLIDPAERTIEPFDLAGKSYRSRPKLAGADRLCSTAVSGFDISLEAVFDAKANFAELRRLVA